LLGSPIRTIARRFPARAESGGKGRRQFQRANFVDIAEKAGLTATNVFGGVDTRNTIETTGTGVAILTMIRRLAGYFIVTADARRFSRDQAPPSSLSNNHDGTFTDVTAKPG